MKTLNIRPTRLGFHLVGGSLNDADIIIGIVLFLIIIIIIVVLVNIFRKDGGTGKNINDDVDLDVDTGIQTDNRFEDSRNNVDCIGSFSECDVSCLKEYKHTTVKKGNGKECPFVDGSKVICSIG